MKQQKQRLYQFFFKTALILNTIIIGQPISLALLGLMNRLMGRPIGMIFVTYAAIAEYYEYFSFKKLKPILERYPLFIGILKQNKKFGLVFGSGLTERQFKDIKKITALNKWMHCFASLVGAQEITYGGILPTELHKRNLVDSNYLHNRCNIVAQVIFKAEQKIRNQLDYKETVPVILIGGKGSIGSSIGHLLRQANRKIYIVDQNDEFPHNLKNQVTIVIDVARKGILERYLEFFWPEMVILNETYPYPNLRTQAKLRKKGIKLFHLVGVEGQMIPSLPGNYKAGIPCCAMFENQNFDPIFKRLV